LIESFALGRLIKAFNNLKLGAGKQTHPFHTLDHV
jgi:hypothetical protein